MEVFNLSKINIYSIDELVEFILSGSTTKEQLYKNGLFRPNRPLLEMALEMRDREDWERAKAEGSEASLFAYLSIYDKNEPLYKGLFVEEAKNMSVLQNDKPVEIEVLEQLPAHELANTADEITQIVSSLYYNANRKELSSTDNSAWLKATSQNTIYSYEEYLRVYKNNPWGYEGKHVGDAKKRILQLQEASDWLHTSIAKTKDAFNKYISKYEPIKHLLTTNHLEDANKWLATPAPSPLLKLIKKVVGFIAICAVVCLCIWIYKYLTRPDVPQPLSQEEITRIIKVKQDSLRIDLFDGFYLTPATMYQGNEQDSICSRDASEYNSSDNSPSGPTSKEEVLAEYILTLNGKYNIANKNGDIIDIPEAQNGIDSICLKNSPFIEYIDNNGLRRVVALFKDEVYYYLGDCGFTIEGKKRYILSNGNNKIGMIDSDLRIIHDFTNEGIYPITPNGYCISNAIIKYFGNTGQPIAFQNYDANANLRKQNYPANKLLSFQEEFLGPYGFKNMDNQIIIQARFKDVSEFNDDGYAAVGTSSTPNKGYCDKWGVINSKGDLIIPMKYEKIFLSSSGPILAKQNSRWGYIDYDDKEVIPFKFKNAHVFIVPMKLASVSEDGSKYGYINTKGDYVIKPEFYYAGSYTGLTAVEKYGKYFYLSSKNEKVTKIPDIFDRVDSFNPYTSLGRVRYNGTEWYINTNGAFCYPASPNLKPSEQSIQTQIASAKEKAEREQAEREGRGKSNDDRKARKL